MKKVNNIAWGLFLGKPQPGWIKDCLIYIKRIFFTLKHGYPPQANWETFAWFIDVMKEILSNYRYQREGTLVVLDDYYDKETGQFRDEENTEAANKLYDHMLDLLSAMDENNPLYENWSFEEREAAMENAKDEFFMLFSKYFFSFWD